MRIKAKRNICTLLTFSLLVLLIAACGQSDEGTLATAQALADAKLTQTSIAAAPANTPISQVISTSPPAETSTPTPEPAPIGGESLIAFASNRDDNYEIYVMDSQGSGLTRLTNNPGDDYSPVWSPYSQQIAFISYRPGGVALFMMNADGSEFTRISGDVGEGRIGGPQVRPGEPLAWSQAGQIAYTRHRCAVSCSPEEYCTYPFPQDYPNWFQWDAAYNKYLTCLSDAESLLTYEYSSDIYALLARKDYDELPSFGFISRDTEVDFEYPAWSPDDKQLAVAVGVDSQQEIQVINAETGAITARLTNNPANDYAPAWSSDGQRIVFVSDRDGNPEIYVMDADGRNQTRLTNNSADDLSPVWSPDNSAIAFVSNRDGNKEIYVMNADGSLQTRLTDNPAEDISPHWSSSVYISDISSPSPETTGEILFSSTFEDMDGWYPFQIGPGLYDDYVIDSIRDKLYIEINVEQTTAYAIYSMNFGRPDLRIEVSTETVTYPRNNINLLCRATEAGWYEFSMNSGGLWSISKYDGVQKTVLADGGSRAINLQQSKNEITAICQGNTLSFVINDVEIGSVEDSQFIEGYIGLSVSSFDDPGVGVEFDDLSVSVP